ncbi:MAG TPA: class F sortase [Candidatus Dormibacteraeota bacterium]|nr:class F sortase [Candidatus Dormibacteraeota bacterium]
METIAGQRRTLIGLIAAAALVAAACGGPGHLAAKRPRLQLTPSPTAPASVRHLPAQLVIPKIGVRANVEEVGTDGHGDMGVPKDWHDVAWYAPGVVPGQPGDAVMAGHLDWYGGVKAVFWSLAQLQPGDMVRVVTKDGLTLDFQVSDREKVPYTAHPAGLFATSGPPQLSLITCTGTWDTAKSVYLERLIVNANYVGSA